MSPALQVVRALLVVVTAAAAATSGLAASSGDRRLVVLPIVGVLAIALGVMSITRFAPFVLLLLVVRPVLDMFKLSASTTGNTSGNTVASRGLDPSTLVAVLFMVASLLWLAARHQSGHAVKVSRVTWALVAFMATAYLSVLGSNQPQASALESLRITAAVLMFIVLEQLIDSRKVMTRVVTACYVGLAYPVVYTLFGIVAGDPSSEVRGSFSRLTGPFTAANIFARYLSFMIIFGVAIYPSLKPRVKALMALILIPSVILLFLTLTLTAILGAALGVVVVAIAQRRFRLVFGLAAVGVIVLLTVPSISQRVSSVSPDTQIGSTSENSLAWRLTYWAEVLPLADRNPVTGIGLTMTQYETDAAKQPHNDFIRAYVETGVLGLGAFSALCIALVGNARRALQRATQKTLEHSVAAGSLGVTAAFVLGCLTSNAMSNVVSLWYLFAFAAAATFVSRTAGAASANAGGGAGAGGSVRGEKTRTEPGLPAAN